MCGACEVCICLHCTGIFAISPLPPSLGSLCGGLSRYLYNCDILEHWLQPGIRPCGEGLRGNHIIYGSVGCTFSAHCSSLPEFRGASTETLFWGSLIFVCTVLCISRMRLPEMQYQSKGYPTAVGMRRASVSGNTPSPRPLSYHLPHTLGLSVETRPTASWYATLRLHGVKLCGSGMSALSAIVPFSRLLLPQHPSCSRSAYSSPASS
jgi:hypothetical protein